MAEYRGFRIPEELSYDMTYHVWVRREGDLVVVGATDPAQGSAGDIIHMTAKKVGTPLKRGGILATIESAKYMGPMRAPVSGAVAEINADAIAKPTLINADAYGTWVAKIRADKPDEDLANLVTGAEAAELYRSIIDEWGIGK